MILNRKTYNILLALFILAGIISLFAGLKNAYVYFIDFQQPAACLFISGENPYLYHLNKSVDNNLWSAPNYLHTLYFLLSPLCLIDDNSIARLTWAIINTLLATWIVYKLTILANIKYLFVLILMIFFMSLPFRNGIGNDQNQILILTFFTLTILYNDSSKLKGLFGALSYTKYSFSASWIGMNLFKDKASVLWSVFLVLLFMSVGSLWISSGNFISDFFGPINVASSGVSPGHADMLTLFDMFVGSDYHYRTLLGISLLILNILFVALITKKSSDLLYNLSIAGVSSLMFVTHLEYDGVFLLPALIYILSKKANIYTLVGLFSLTYPWFLVKVLYVFDIFNLIDISSIGQVVVQFLLYFLLILSLIKVQKNPCEPILQIK